MKAFCGAGEHGRLTWRRDAGPLWSRVGAASGDQQGRARGGVALRGFRLQDGRESFVGSDLSDRFSSVDREGRLIEEDRLTQADPMLRHFRFQL